MVLLVDSGGVEELGIGAAVNFVAVAEGGAKKLSDSDS